MNILFITRKFPPKIGGMEKFAYELYENLSKQANIYLVSWNNSQWFLPLFLPCLLIISMYKILTKIVDVIYIADALLSPLALLLKWCSGLPAVVTVHGNDIVFPLWIYQKIVPACVRKLDAIICVSENTRKECIKRGIPEHKIEVINNAINDVSREQ